MEFSPGTNQESTVPPRERADRLPEAIAFGARVRQLREKRGWTQERLAAEADVHVVQVSHIEMGATDPKLSTVLKLAKAFQMAPSALFRPLDKRG